MQFTAIQRYELLKAMIQREYTLKDHAEYDDDTLTVTMKGETYTVPITATEDHYSMYTDHNKDLELQHNNVRTVKNPQTAYNYAERFYLGMSANQYKDYQRYQRVKQFIK